MNRFRRPQFWQLGQAYQKTDSGHSRENTPIPRRERSFTKPPTHFREGRILRRHLPPNLSRLSSAEVLRRRDESGSRIDAGPAPGRAPTRRTLRSPSTRVRRRRRRGSRGRLKRADRSLWARGSPPWEPGGAFPAPPGRTGATSPAGSLCARSSTAFRYASRNSTAGFPSAHPTPRTWLIANTEPCDSSGKRGNSISSPLTFERMPSNR